MQTSSLSKVTNSLNYSQKRLNKRQYMIVIMDFVLRELGEDLGNYSQTSSPQTPWGQHWTSCQHCPFLKLETIPLNLLLKTQKSLTPWLLVNILIIS